MSTSPNRAINAGKQHQKDCVDANPRLVMAVVAIGMIVGALLSPGKPADSSNAIVASADR